MPKISDSQRTGRRNQILEAAFRCFVRSGFRAASMRDICREAKLSPGAVYLYFASKESIVDALAEYGRGQTLEWVGRLKSMSLEAGMDQLLKRLEQPEALPVFRLDVGLWGEAIQTPRLAELFKQSHASLVSAFAEVILNAAPRSTAGEAQTAARLLMAVISGFELQKVMNPDLDLKPAITLLKSMFQEIGSKRRNLQCKEMRPRRRPR